LPTELELTKAHVESFLPGGSTIPGGFRSNVYYWSGTEYDVDRAWSCGWQGSYLLAGTDTKTNVFAVRCVKI